MTYLVGDGPRNDGRRAIALACQLAQSEPQPVRAVSVVPQGWMTPTAGGTDREYQTWVEHEGRALRAQSVLAEHPSVQAATTCISARSVPQALLDESEREAA